MTSISELLRIGRLVVVMRKLCKVRKLLGLSGLGAGCGVGRDDRGGVSDDRLVGCSVPELGRMVACDNKVEGGVVLA